MENHPPFDEEFTEWCTAIADEDSDMGFGPDTLMPGSPDAALVAFAKEIQTDATALCNYAGQHGANGGFTSD